MAVYWKISQRLLQEKTSVQPDPQGTATVTSKKENTSLIASALSLALDVEGAPPTVFRT
jgi:hypothetical protein